MHIGKMATAVVVTLGGLLLAAPAQAQPPYPPGPASLTVSPAVVEEGDVVTVTGRNFGPNDLVTITVNYIDLDASTDAANADAAAGTASQNIERGRDPHWGKYKDPHWGKDPHKGKYKDPHKGKYKDPHKGKGRDRDRDIVRTVRADANGNFVTFIRLHEDGIARITAVGRPSGIRASARVIVLCDEDSGHRADNQQKAPAPAPVPAQAQAQAQAQAPALALAPAPAPAGAPSEIAAKSWLHVATRALSPIGVSAMGYVMRW